MARSVLILMGSKSDLEIMRKAADTLEKLGVEHEMTIASAHRTPERVDTLVRGARDRGVGAVIAGAGMAAHLAGVCASKTTLPVIGVPLSGSKLVGVDALLATVQMPPGMPVATVGIDMAANAALLAAQMLAVEDADLARKLEDERERRAKAVEEAAAEL
ncbi:MAG: 5-(carboxyamino)imidazole ribonucleotide mutase [Armatimonadia bacterium]|nr:5-(carboxyamino)imidazole ribonucleotide mutase [Armatimonadia bacterium]